MMSTTTNALNNSATVFQVDNLNFNGNTISSTTSGDITLVPFSNRVAIDKSASGATLSCRVFNSSATASSDAFFNAVSSSGGGNAYSQWTDQNQSFQQGIVQGTSALREYVSGFSSGTLLRQITSEGEQTLPLQPAFLVTANAQANVTGDGTIYTIQWANEIFDQGSDFATNTFTAPVTGRYSFSLMVRATGLAAVNTTNALAIVTSNRTYAYTASLGVMRDVNNNCSAVVTQLTDMDEGDTATTTLQISGGGLVVGIGTATSTQWSGNLRC